MYECFFFDKFVNYFELICMLADAIYAILSVSLSICLSLLHFFSIFVTVSYCEVHPPPPRQSEWIFSGDTGYTVTISRYSETYPGEDLGLLFIQSSGGRYQYMTILRGGGGACIGNVPILDHIL